MAAATPWYPGNDPGHVKALVSNAERMARIISRARRILLVTGPLVAGCKPAISVMKAIPSTCLVASPTTRPAISKEKGIEPVAYMNVLEVMDRVRDPDWRGFDGKGRYNLVILLGMDYYYASQMFSLMKHFGQGVKTMSLDGYYQPNATYSLSNLRGRLWDSEIAKVAELLGGEA
jgi:acetyl-CoA decarbonylase/synthase complex subunit epsilon